MNKSPTIFRRGVRVSDPAEPAFTYMKFWQRRLPNLVGGALSEPMSRVIGADRVRNLLNHTAGSRVFWTEQRVMPAFGNRLGVHGFLLAPGGCEWAIARHGGCTFCPFQDEVDRYVGDLPLDHHEFLALFRAGFGTMQRHVDWVGYFTAGSATNRGEIPAKTMYKIAEIVSQAPRVKALRVESRVQHMDPDYLGELSAVLRRKPVMLDIAIGLETQDDGIRNKLLNKGMSKRQFETAVEAAKALGVRITAYVMLKGHWALGEGFAIEECLRSVAYAFGVGVDEVQLQPLYISPDGREMHQRFLKQECKPPWLWSVVEVLKRSLDQGPVIVGPWDGELPTPIAVPQNCERCTPALMASLVAWRQTLDPRVWDDSNLPGCACHEQWRGEVSATQASPALG